MLHRLKKVLKKVLDILNVYSRYNQLFGAVLAAGYKTYIRHQDGQIYFGMCFNVDAAYINFKAFFLF